MRYLASAAALLLVAGGCGGSAAHVGGAASVIPANVNTFVAVAAGAPLDQLRTVLPREAQLVARMRRTRGGEIDVAELADGKLFAVTKQKGAWTPAFAGPHLADAQAYRDAQAHVDSGARIRGYLAPAVAERTVASLPGQLQIVPSPGRAPRVSGGPRIQLAARHFQWGALELVGSRFSTLVRSSTASEAARARSVEVRMPPFAAHLLDEIPADATFVADFQTAPSMFENTDPSDFPKSLQRLIEASPQLPSELDQLLGGESAIYRRAGGEVTLVTQPLDLRNVESTVVEVAQELRIDVPLRHAFLGGELIVSTSQRGIDAFRGDGPKLAADPAFRAAAKAAGLPAATNGLVYETAPSRISWADHVGALNRLISVLR
jgi:hypothetical protein